MIVVSGVVQGEAEIASLKGDRVVFFSTLSSTCFPLPIAPMASPSSPPLSPFSPSRSHALFLRLLLKTGKSVSQSPSRSPTSTRPPQGRPSGNLLPACPPPRSPLYQAHRPTSARPTAPNPTVPDRKKSGLAICSSNIVEAGGLAVGKRSVQPCLVPVPSNSHTPLPFQANITRSKEEAISILNEYRDILARDPSQFPPLGRWYLSLFSPL